MYIWCGFPDWSRAFTVTVGSFSDVLFGSNRNVMGTPFTRVNRVPLGNISVPVRLFRVDVRLFSVPEVRLFRVDVVLLSMPVVRLFKVEVVPFNVPDVVDVTLPRICALTDMVFASGDNNIANITSTENT